MKKKHISLVQEKKCNNSLLTHFVHLETNTQICNILGNNKKNMNYTYMGVFPS